MLRLVLLTIFMSVTAIAVQAQTPSVKGMAKDRIDNKPVTGATVLLLLQLDSSTVKTTVTDSSGAFFFGNVPNDSFIVTINTLNYQQYVSFFTINNNEKDLGSLNLDRQGKDLSTVVVVAKVAPVTQKGDTAQFSASQYKVNPDATTEDLIKKMPGITVAKDGTVTAQGETVKKVTIDGKDFFGDDASAALKNLPSEVVDKIQVFDRLSDQAQLTGFDDGNSQKSINIVTKSGIKNGQFGRAYVGYGTDDRYAAGGNVSFFNGNRRISLVGNFNNINQQNFGSQDLLGITSSGNSRGGGGGRGGGGFGGGNNFTVGQAAGISKTNAFGINYGDQWGKKLNVTGSYFFNNSINNNDYRVNTQTLDSINGINNLETGTSYSKNFNHRINMRLEYKIDSSNSLFIIPSINLQKNNSVSNSISQSYKGIDDSTTNAIVNNNNDRNGYNIRNSILFRHAFSKKGRSVSLGFNTTFTQNDGEAINQGSYRYYNNGSPVRDSVLDQFADRSTDGKTIGGSIAYTEPVGKKGQIQIDYNPSVQKNSSDNRTFNYDGGKYTSFDSTLSNKFDNTITTNNAGLNYRLMKSRDEMFSIGVNFQNSRLQSDRTFPSVTKVDQSFTNLLPNLMWRKKISTNSNVRLFYRSSVNFPNVNQLQDVIDISNPLRVSSGNPALSQSFTNFLSGRYTYTNSKTSRSFFANVFVQTAKDYISNAVYTATNGDSTLAPGLVIPRFGQLVKPVNLDGYRSLNTFFTYSMPVKSIKTTVNLSAGFNYSRLPGLLNYISTVTNNYVYTTGVVLASNISEFVDFNISYNANFNDARTTGKTSQVNKYVNQTAGLQLNLLNKKGWFVQNDVNNQTYSGLTGGLNQSYWLWNAALGKKFLKNNAGELKLSVFDLLKQNQSITRTVNSTEIIDSQNDVLQQYFMLTFTYNLKNFGTAKAGAAKQNTENRPPMGGPGGMGF
ncbi:MAG: TonB-dependent receptor [Ferruginibacter sp.]|nr:TonB-dependent receptor [Ferruginibacter sp.]